MDSVRSRWPILLYFFIAWMVFGSESNFPAIEFSIGKKQAPGPTILSVPAPITTVSPGTPVAAVPASPTAAAQLPPSTTPPVVPTTTVEPQALQVPPASDGAAAVRTALATTSPPHGRQSAESPELRALRSVEEEFSLNLGATERPRIIPRPEPSAAESCVPPPDRLSSRDWSRGFEDGWPEGLQYPRLPVSNDPRVSRYIGYFTSTAEGRKTFATWLRRSGKYRDVFAGILEQRRLPTDLAAVAFVESGLWPTAVSKAGATGLWQFMPQTARAYGLEVHDQFDERRSIWRSTQAAADHLRDLYQRFGSWELALAAYNMGYRRLSRALQQAGTEDFWSVSSVPGSLPRETTLYVPKVLAVAIILNNLSYFSFDDVQPMAALDATPIEVPPGVALATVARATGTTVQQLREFNPDLAYEVTPNVGRLLNVYVPRGGADAARSNLQSPEFELSRSLGSAVEPSRAPATQPWSGQPEWQARLRSTDPAAVADPNAEFGADSRLGQSERGARMTPGAPAQVDWITWGRSPNPTSAPNFVGIDLTPPKPTNIEYRVTTGDTLWSIARAHGVRETQIANDNHLLDGSLLNTGQLLMLCPRTTILQ